MIGAIATEKLFKDEGNLSPIKKNVLNKALVYYVKKKRLHPWGTDWVREGHTTHDYKRTSLQKMQKKMCNSINYKYSRWSCYNKIYIYI